MTSEQITVSVNANGEISLTWPAPLDFDQDLISAIRLTSILDDDDPQQILCETCAEVLGIPDSLARALCSAVPRSEP